MPLTAIQRPEQIHSHGGSATRAVLTCLLDNANGGMSLAGEKMGDSKIQAEPEDCSQSRTIYSKQPGQNRNDGARKLPSTNRDCGASASQLSESKSANELGIAQVH
jgi:hypothetical protein